MSSRPATDEVTGSALEAGLVPVSSVASMVLEPLHLEDPFAVVLKSEIDQPPEVDGGDAQ